MQLSIRLLLLIATLWFAACGTLPQTDPDDDLPRLDTPLTELRPLSEWAAQLPLSALQHPLLQPQLNPTSVTDYMLELAKILYLQGEHDSSLELMRRLDPAVFNRHQLRNYAIIQAFNEQALNRPHWGLVWLQPPYRELFADLPWSQQLVLNQLQADLLSADGQYLTAAQLRHQLLPLLPSAERQDWVDTLWQDVRAISELELTLPYALGEDWDGWLALVRLERLSAGNLVQLQAAIEQWRQDFPEHPGVTFFPNALAQQLSDLPRPIQSVALILPLPSDLSGPGQRILEGFLAGYYQALSAGQPVPHIQIYNEQSAPTQTLVQLAIDDGAEFIIGPLERRNVAELESLGTLPIPILALNRTPRTLGYHPQVFQMALAPEDEARQVARLARQAGHEVAAVMVPEGEWGERVATAFTQTWLDLDGRLVQLQTLPARDDGRQYLVRVQTVLDIAQSQQRASNIQAVIGRSVESEARPRGDLDLVFLATNPEQTRQIVSLFNFQLADHIQLMAISNAVAATRSDRDAVLTGLRVVETPWRLQPHPLHRALQALHDPAAPDRFERLHALGLDAWQLMQQSAALQNQQWLRFYGQTGLLELNAQQQLLRELAPAEFRSGRLIPLAPNNGETPEFLLRHTRHESTTR